MAEFSNPRTVERFTVRADVASVEDITELPGTRSERTFRPDFIKVEYVRFDGGEWSVIGPEISGPVLKKNGEPGERVGKLWQPALFPKWGVDFIEAQRPTGGQP